MKRFTKAALIIGLVGALCVPSFSVGAQPKEASAAMITTTKTGYTSAEDVVYKKSGSYVANWGARGEDCTFLSSYAEAFYTGSDTYATLSKKSGGSSQSNASQSSLYSSLKSMMTNKHSHQTSYDETKNQYRYTDCLRNDTAHISSFYSGKQLTGDWDSAATWNREHTWPDSKGLSGRDETDIMMLRPTWVQENSSRGNTAYGESSSYYDPGESTRGDCARIVLYVYTRWGNTDKMWGSSGVMENMNVLLRWMEEDPVDTWEMGRNDAVQAITGTRNVFVDYPEYAWLLFGQAIPNTVSTPSGIASKGNGNVDSSTEEDASTEVDSSSENSSATPDSSSEEEDSRGEDSESEATCKHEYGQWFVITKPTESAEGERERFCNLCGEAQTNFFRLGEEDAPESTEGNEENGGMAGCAGTVSSVEVSVLFAIVCAYALKRRERLE